MLYVNNDQIVNDTPPSRLSDLMPLSLHVIAINAFVRQLSVDNTLQKYGLAALCGCILYLSHTATLTGHSREKADGRHNETTLSLATQAKVVFTAVKMKVFKTLCTFLGLEKLLTTAQPLQADEQVKQYNQNLRAALRHYVFQNSKDWDICLQEHTRHTIERRIQPWEHPPAKKCYTASIHLGPHSTA